MKAKRFLSSFLLILTAASLTLVVNQGEVSASSLDQGGSVTVTGRGTTDPVDPETPGEEVNPGEDNSTTGALRFDFVSSLDFGDAKITDSNRIFYARGQLFHSDTPARGSYIQITDERENADGWTLQVKQNYQFRNDVVQESSEQELTGAVLSFDKGWANAINTSKMPTVTRDTINISNINNSYEVARAASGNGYGTWTIEFGASGSNQNDQGNTLTPLVDETGAPIMDELYQKQAYQNSAISLTIPDATKIYPVQYETELTWLLAELP